MIEDVLILRLVTFVILIGANIQVAAERIWPHCCRARPRGVDKVTPPSPGRKVFEAIPGESKRWIPAKGAGHDGIFSHKEVGPRGLTPSS